MSDVKTRPETKDAAKTLPRWPFVLAGLVVLGFVAAVLWFVFAPRPDAWTNDAQVRVHYVAVAPRVPGQVIAVLVDDNQPVKAGQVLARLDQRSNATPPRSATRRPTWPGNPR